LHPFEQRRIVLGAMSDKERVTCGAHGETPATFTCRHIATGLACGFHASEGEPDDPWPDAWCDLCEEAYQAAGETWNDESERVASIQLLCSRCYEAARDRNLRVPPLARGLAARLVDDEIAELIHHAVHASREAGDPSHRRWGWRDMARWAFDDEASTLTFSDSTRATVLADVCLVGSYSSRSGTFQWAWETYEKDAREAVAISRLRVFGEVRGISRLVTPNFACEEADGWEMAALAGYLLGAEGLYGAPFDHQRWFMLLSTWRASNGSPR
jgi:hypothetical protein